MPTRHPSLRRPPIGFAHRGARAHAPENTLEAFQLALRLGATGLESDVWLTARRRRGARPRRRRRAGVRRERSPSCRPGRPARRTSRRWPSSTRRAAPTSSSPSTSRTPAAAPAVVAAARAADRQARQRLWLCHHGPRRVASWRDAMPDVQLVDSTRLRRIKRGPERHAAALPDAGIDAVNLHHTEWTGGSPRSSTASSVLAFGWDAQHERILDELLDMGIDGGLLRPRRPHGRRPRAGATEASVPTASRCGSAARCGRTPAHDRVLVDRAEAPAVLGVGAVVAHHEHVALRAP